MRCAAENFSRAQVSPLRARAWTGKAGKNSANRMALKRNARSIRPEFFNFADRKSPGFDYLGQLPGSTTWFDYLVRLPGSTTWFDYLVRLPGSALLLNHTSNRFVPERVNHQSVLLMYKTPLAS